MFNKFRLPPHDALHSTVVGTIVGGAYILIGLATINYPPEYFSYPQTWGWIFIFGGMVTWSCLFIPSLIMCAIAGGLTVGSALFRSLAIYWELGFSRIWKGVFGENPISNTLFIVGTAWFMISALLWLAWPVMAADLIRKKEDGPDGISTMG